MYRTSTYLKATCLERSRNTTWLGTVPFLHPPMVRYEKTVDMYQAANRKPVKHPGVKGFVVAVTRFGIYCFFFLSIIHSVLFFFI